MKKQILIVDDELSNIKLLNSLLCEDYDVVIKKNGADAICWLEEGNDPALVISDLEMPYMDGLVFIHNLKTSGYYGGTPVILLSGADNLEMIAEQMPYGADCFLTKPFTATTLKSSIKEVLLQK